MPVDVSVKFIGLKAIKRAMDDLPKQINRRKEVLDPGLVAGAAIVRDAARNLAPVLQQGTPARRPLTLRRNIIVQRWPRPDQGIAATVVVRVRKLKEAAIARFKARLSARGKMGLGRENPNDPFYWRFVEFGTSKMAARPFLRPAFDVNKVRGVEAAIVEFRKRVQDTVEKLGRRSAYDKFSHLLLLHKGRR